MAAWLESIWNSIVTLFDWIVWFLSGGVFDLITDAFDYFIGILKIWFLNMSTWVLETVDSMISGIFSGVSFSSDIENAWNGLPLDVIQAAVFFNVPQSVAIITGAYVTRFIIRMMPFV
ncbi:MAG: DUF2523 domain-containing protein [Magnetococcales bacterium]|nr:DUF2523 domain-containing protein [Magnetococcales bacterium]